MSKVKFGDIVKDVKINVDRDNNPYEFYVAGDHMDSEDLNIHRKGRFATDDVGPAFTRIFKKGQVLYGSRRTYLKKVAVADFDGICANTTFVFESKDSTVFEQQLLPFLMLSERFTNWSITHSKGSTNPYVLFSDLASYEFDLPSLAEQKVLAEKLWAAYEVKQSYLKMIAATEEMVKAQFIEMFEGDKYPYSSLEDVSDEWLKGQPFKKEEIDEKGTLSCIHYGELFTKYGPIIEHVISKTNATPIRSSNIGDILFPASDVTPNGLTRCSMLSKKDVVLGGDIIILRPKKDYNARYLSCAINQQKSQLLKRVNGAVVKHLSAKGLKTVVIPIPPMDKQDEYVALYNQADKSISELRKSVDAIDKVIKSLINENL